MYLKRSLMIAGIAMTTLLTGCMTPLEQPKSSQSSMAIIQPIVSGKMRVGLSWNTYSYYPHPSRVQFMNNWDRVICPAIKNKSSGNIFNAKVLMGENLISQCYYPNIEGGSYEFQDYKFDNPGEEYRVLVVTLYRSLLFRHHELDFSIKAGEVKDLGRYIIFMEQSGGDMAITHIQNLGKKDSIEQAKLDLKNQKSNWRVR